MTDEVLGLLRYLIEGLVLEVPPDRGDVRIRLRVAVARKWRESGEAAKSRRV